MIPLNFLVWCNRVYILSKREPPARGNGLEELVELFEVAFVLREGDLGVGGHAFCGGCALVIFFEMGVGGRSSRRTEEREGGLGWGRLLAAFLFRIIWALSLFYILAHP